MWDLEADEISFPISIPKRPFTPRGVLAINHSVFDALGYLCPVLLKGRLIQRKLFESRENKPKGVAVNWDEVLRLEYKIEWDSWVNSLEELKGVKIPRSYYSSDIGTIERRELFAFSDASLDAIGYAIYLRYVGTNGINVSMIAGGAKLAPRGETSIPRLELSAALEASLATQQVALELKVGQNDIYYFTDSNIVRSYLLNREKRFVRYVSRRVEMISNVTNKAPWHYIKSEDNPADIASRPQTVSSLLNSCWFEGPPFLKEVIVRFEPMTTLHYENLPEIVSDPVVVLKTVSDFGAGRCLFENNIGRVGKLSRAVGFACRILGMLNWVDRV